MASPVVTKGSGTGWVGVLIVGLVLTILLLSYSAFIWPWMMRWNASDAEITTPLLGDELVADATEQTTKAVTIDAPPEAIYPWLLQLGVDRGGMYSHDWLENLFLLNVHSTNCIVPELQELKVGDFISFLPPDYFISPGPGVYIMQLVPNRALIGCYGMDGTPPEPCTSTWQFVLKPQADVATRLIVRTRTLSTGSAFTMELAKLFTPVPFIMERGMLLGLKARAEGTLGNRPALYTAAAVGWIIAVLGVLAFFLSRRGWWPWLLLPLVVAYLIFRPTGDMLAAAAGFISLGLVILGGLAFGRKGWSGFLAVGSLVLLVLLFSADAYLTFGSLFILAAPAALAHWTVTPRSRHRSSPVPS
jgi:hypothetical protein